MSRIETIGNATLYLGDCMEILPTLGKVDAVITDPPYGIALNTDSSRFSGGTAGNMAKRGNGVGSAGGRPIHGDGEPFDPSFLTAYGDGQIVWGWNNYPHLLPRGACLVWIKKLDAAFGSFLSDAETAWLSKGHGVYCKRDLSNHAVAKERIHPTQKPLSLMLWCLEFFPKAELIADPFMGSGTTGVAALQMGKKFIGIEKDAEYFSLACKRIEQAHAQGQLFAPTQAAPVQLGLEAA